MPFLHLKQFTLVLIPVGKFFSAFASLVIKEQWAAVKCPGSNWGYSVLLKDTLEMQQWGE